MLGCRTSMFLILTVILLIVTAFSNHDSDRNEFSHNLQLFEWSMKSNGKSPCQFHLKNPYFPAKLHLGETCKASTTFPTKFIEKFSDYHIQRNQDQYHPNFEKLMLFDIKLVMKVKSEDMLELTKLARDLVDIHDGSASEPVESDNTDTISSTNKNLPTLYTHLVFGNYVDRWIPMNQSYQVGQTTYDSNPDVSLSEDVYLQYNFDYNLAWSPHYIPNQHIAVDLELDFNDFRDRISPLPMGDSRRVRFKRLLKSFHVVMEAISVSYVVQPKKFDFTTYYDERCHNPEFVQMIEDRYRQQESRDPCFILGTNCGVIFRRLQVPKDLPLHQVSKFHHNDGISSHECSAITSAAEEVDNERTKQVVDDRTGRTSLPRVFCGIFTKASNHNTHVRGIQHTWARKCTAFLAFSTIDDPTIPSINLPHIGEEIYGNMWQKSRSIWKYIATHYIHDFDWFLMGGDDMYYIMENLYKYITSDEIVRIQQQYHDRNNEDNSTSNNRYHGLYLGRILTEPASAEFNATDYNTGGPGYLLDVKALEVLRDNMDKSHCYPFNLHSGEDVFLSECLLNSEPSITPYNTTDHFGRHRFLLYPAGTSYMYDVEERKLQKHWLLDYDPYVRGGHDCCSDDVISIHFVNSYWMLTMDDFLYRCPRERIDQYYREYGLDFFDRVVYAQETGRRK